MRKPFSAPIRFNFSFVNFFFAGRRGRMHKQTSFFVGANCVHPPRFGQISRANTVRPYGSTGKVFLCGKGKK